MNTTCNNCGTLFAANSKYCRQCGRPAPAPWEASVTEATTRSFDVPDARATMPPVFATADNAAETAPLAASARTSPVARNFGASFDGQSQKFALPIVLCTVLLIALVASAAVWYAAQATSAGVPPITAPAPPVPPVIAVPAPPAPPAPPAFDGAVPGELIYPNAQVTQNIVKPGKTTLLMQSSDNFDTVVQWYKSNLQTNKRVESANNVVLQAGRTTVVINGTGNGGTSIVLVNK